MVSNLKSNNYVNINSYNGSLQKQRKMNNLNYNEKLSLLHNLLTLTRVDHVESEIEMDFIYKIGKKLNITKIDIDGLLGKEVDFHPPKGEDQRIVLFYTFLLVIKIDGYLAPEELTFCKDIGFKLGLNPFAVSNLLDSMLESIDNRVPALDVIKFFKLYHN